MGVGLSLRFLWFCLFLDSKNFNYYGFSLFSFYLRISLLCQSSIPLSYLLRTQLIFLTLAPSMCVSCQFPCLLDLMERHSIMHRWKIHTQKWALGYNWDPKLACVCGEIVLSHVRTLLIFLHFFLGAIPNLEINLSVPWFIPLLWYFN